MDAENSDEVLRGLEDKGAQLVRERFGRDCRCVGRVRAEFRMNDEEWQAMWTFYYETVDNLEPSCFDVTSFPDGSLSAHCIEQIPRGLLGSHGTG